MKNSKSKGGLVLLGISLCLALIGMKSVKAEGLNLKNDNPYNYTYTTNGKVRPFYLAINLEDSKPLFQERGNVDFSGTDTYIKLDRKLYMEPYELNALYLTTNGGEATKENEDKRLAMQLYIFEEFAKINKDTISFSFDTSKYHQISDELLNQGKEMIKPKKYNYQVKQGEWTYIPKEWEGNYQIKNKAMLQFKQEDDGFMVKGDNLGTYTTDIVIENFKEYGYYFDSNYATRSNYTEVIRPCTAKPVLEIEVVPANYDIHFSSEQVGYKLDMPASSLKGEEVKYDLQIDDGYELKSLKITKEDNSIIEVNDNAFIMPNSDVYVEVIVEKKSYNIKVINDFGVTLDCLDKAYSGDKVVIKATIDEGYVLTNLYVNNEAIDLNDLSFVMPNSDVVIMAETKKKIYQIKSHSENATVEVLGESEFDQDISFKVLANPGYEVVKITVTLEDGKEILVTNNTFKMPKANVVINVWTQKKMYRIDNMVKNLNIAIVSNAYYGDEVILKIIDNKLYDIKSIYYLDDNDEKQVITDNKFIMPNGNIRLFAEVSLKKFKVSFVDVDANKTLRNDLFVEAGQILSIPYFDEYFDIMVYDEFGSIEYLSDEEYVIDRDITLMYGSKLDDEEEYYFDEIPNTFENGYEPLFGIITMALFIYFKKHLLA